MRRVMILGAVLALAACSAEAVDPVAEEDQTLKIRAELAIEQRLRDPKSAQFESFVSRISGTPVVCGTVNSKNAFGGYSGRQPFVYAGGIATLSEEVGSESFAGFWDDNCKPLPE